MVTAQDLDMVVGRLEVDGKFDEDNRAGFPNQLHRISVLRRKVYIRAKRVCWGRVAAAETYLFMSHLTRGARYY